MTARIEHDTPALGALGGFQDAFAAALLDPDGACGTVRALALQPGFAVYRNTVVKGCIDALQANFPTVTALVGEEWLRAAAAVHVREALPPTPLLLEYGERFPAFLDGFEPARALPYLGDVARCDRLWTEAHLARDEAPLAAAAVVALDRATLGTARLRLHAAARWVWFETTPAAAIWGASREQLPLEDIDWQPGGVLITRPHDTVRWTALDRAGCTFLDACAAGMTVSEAVALALDANPDADLAALMAQILDIGTFTAIHPETLT
jgi:hypothetical protein